MNEKLINLNMFNADWGCLTYFLSKGKIPTNEERVLSEFQMNSYNFESITSNMTLVLSGNEISLLSIVDGTINVGMICGCA